ncbi:hypothetical protein G9A89_010000 [Geosiphon pyriformis]|nr:hypothetical protein G9A89_010000 [Geosiphon pyriformis]
MALFDEHELLQEILAINIVFICRMHGRRAAYHRKEHIRTRKDANECEDKKPQKAVIWVKYMFMRIVVYLGMLLPNIHGKATTNIIDKATDDIDF